MVNRDRLIGYLFDLIRIDSASLKEREISEYMTDKLKKLGFEVMMDDAGEKLGGECGNILARLKGNRGDGDSVMFSAHLDRVTPGFGIHPIDRGDTIVSEGNTILGADDAAGLAAILEMVEILKERGMEYPDIELALTVGEEKGLLGAKNMDCSFFMSRRGYILDSSEGPERIVVQAPSQMSIQMEIIGKAAHAGIEPEKGISAIQVASAAVSRMRLGRINRQTTANIGTISGGRATNIVCDSVVMGAEARSMCGEELAEQIGHMRSALQSACDEYGARFNFTVKEEYLTYRFDEDEPVVAKAVAAAKKIGLEPRLISVGGGSDANIFNKNGIPSIVLSMGYYNPHTTEEYVVVDELMKTVMLMVGLTQE